MHFSVPLQNLTTLKKEHINSVEETTITSPPQVPQTDKNIFNKKTNQVNEDLASKQKVIFISIRVFLFCLFIYFFQIMVKKNKLC